MDLCDTLPASLVSAIQNHAKNLGFLKPKLHVVSGSKNGDSYSGDVYRIVARPDNGELEDCANNNRLITQIAKEINLIAKVAPRTELRRNLYKSSDHFAREKYIYEIVLPSFERFQLRFLSGSEIFQNYPNIISTNMELRNEYILLDDLRASGYENPDRPTPLNYEQCSTVLENLAKFHAISFAFRDQKSSEFNELVSKLEETLFVAPIDASFEGFLQAKIDYAIATLIAPEDRINREKISEFGKVYGKSMIDCVNEKNFGVICHGDCWISNLMFNTKTTTADSVKFLDWQVTRFTTPVLDLSYFIFCCTDTKLREKLPELLKYYHNVLTERINKLGSDGLKLYPFATFQNHCVKYMRFGLGMALMTLHMTTAKASEMPDVIGILDTMDLTEIDQFATELILQPAYIKRMSGVCRDMVRFGYI